MAQKIQRKNRQTGIITLSTKTLPLIKAGMYWYEGDEFSVKLITDKPIKSVVLLVKGQVIYGDTFFEESVPQDYLKLPDLRTTKVANESDELILPSVTLQSEIAASITFVNKSLAKLKKEVWRGTYLTSSDYACYQSWTVSFPFGTKGFASKGSVCKVRKVLEHYVI